MSDKVSYLLLHNEVQDCISKLVLVVDVNKFVFKQVGYALFILSLEQKVVAFAITVVKWGIDLLQGLDRVNT